MTAISLRYAPAAELRRIRELDAPAADRALAFADACRLNVLYMIERAGSGHIGTSFSSLDLMSWLHLELLRPEDRFFSSKGHDAPGLYSVLVGTGTLPEDLLHGLRRLDGLPGHPDVLTTPLVHTNTGSLGMGVSKARGFVLADRALGRTGRVVVLTGDGELQEGQFWESLRPAALHHLDELLVIVDHNKLQSDTWVAEVSDLGDLEERVRSHGWVVGRANGHDVAAVADAVAGLRAGAEGRPQLLVADTTKGAGVDFMTPTTLPVAGDSLYAYHSGAPSPDEYERACAQIVERLDRRLAALGADPISLVAESVTRPAAPQAPQRLVAAYGDALVAAAEREPRLIALDGDLALDTGLVPFRAAFPERFVECGIAEQDMVSTAGTMALGGLLPAVHSFACFLTPRANEQIYNNATEGTRVIYAGSLVGVVPAGPGHSHQSVRDIALMGSVPGMALIEPGWEAEAAAAVAWAVDEASGSVYVRLISVPWDLGFQPPAAELVPGRGTVLRSGADVMFVATGPVLLSQAHAAADILAASGVDAGVIALPWLRDIDGAWLADAAGDGSIVTLDNHLLAGGQGWAVLAALAEAGAGAIDRVTCIGLREVPRCGTNDEALQASGLDAASLAARVLGTVAVA